MSAPEASPLLLPFPRGPRNWRIRHVEDGNASAVTFNCLYRDSRVGAGSRQQMTAPAARPGPRPDLRSAKYELKPNTAEVVSKGRRGVRRRFRADGNFSSGGYPGREGLTSRHRGRARQDRMRLRPFRSSCRKSRNTFASPSRNGTTRRPRPARSLPSKASLQSSPATRPAPTGSSSEGASRRCLTTMRRRYSRRPA